MNSKNLGRRLALYTSAAGAGVMAGSAMAAPVDANVSIDLTVSSDGSGDFFSEEFDIDITGNGITDFTLSVRDRSDDDNPDSPLVNCGTVRLVPNAYAGAAIAIAGDDDPEAAGYAALIAGGAQVGPDLDFGVDGQPFPSSTSASTLFESCGRSEGNEVGNFDEGTRGFVGLRFELDGNTHYGVGDVQVRRDSTTGEIFSICFEDTPDTPIGTDACDDPEPPGPGPIAVPVGGAVPLGLLLFAAGAAALHRRRRNQIPD